MDIVEALADCIMRFEGWFAPGAHEVDGSTSWRNRNPGNLRPFMENQRRDDKGYRIFDNLNSGWAALTIDINVKLKGDSVNKLSPLSTLHDFFCIYAPPLDNNNPQQYTVTIARWLNSIYKLSPPSPMLVTPMTKLEDLQKLSQIII